MHAIAVPHNRLPPRASAASAVAALFVDECDRDMPRVSTPRPEVHLVVRFGPSARGGLDVHAFGVRETVHRKLVRGVQRVVTARLHLGASEAVLGVSPAAITGRIAALEELWGDTRTRQLCERLAGPRDAIGAAAILADAIAERAAAAKGRSVGTRLALHAAGRLANANVSAVALDLGVSERHLRRVFRETVGVSPKVFARLMRFDRALHIARGEGCTSWATIAAASGYYDQAHLIAEFRSIAGVTPRAPLGELRAAASLG